MSSNSRGDYYKKKTKLWFEEQGYCVEYTEKYRKFQKDGKTYHIKQDLFGADGISISTKHIVFWNSKIGRTGLKKAIDKFNEYPFPDSAGRWIICWTPRVKEPEVIDAQ